MGMRWCIPSVSQAVVSAQKESSHRCKNIYSKKDTHYPKQREVQG